MNRTFLSTALAVLTFAFVGANPVGAEILSTGVDTEAPSAPLTPSPPVIQPGCTVLWFGNPSGDEVTRLQSLGYTVVQTNSPAALAPANLANYEVLVIAFTGPGVIGSAQADIQAFVNSGHGLLIHQPDVAGVLDYVPSGFGVTISSNIWCNYPNDHAATIVNSGHPITSGLVDADLSGDFDTVSGLGAGYAVLARNVVCATPSLAAGTLGLGRVVFEDGNMQSLSADQGSNLYWTNLFNWLCEAEGALPIALDIKPGSCPNPFNVKALGKLPVAILGSAGFDVTDIDVSSLTLAGVAPIRSSIEDVAAPATGTGACECTSAGPDGYADLSLKFSRAEITAALGPVLSGQEIELTISGNLTNGTPFSATDCIVIRPGENGVGAENQGTEGDPDQGIPSLTPFGDGKNGSVQTTWGAIKSRHDK